jgi:hypothetical protein
MIGPSSWAWALSLSSTQHGRRNACEGGCVAAAWQRWNGDGEWAGPAIGGLARWVSAADYTWGPAKVARCLRMIMVVIAWPASSFGSSRGFDAPPPFTSSGCNTAQLHLRPWISEAPRAREGSRSTLASHRSPRPQAPAGNPVCRLVCQHCAWLRPMASSDPMHLGQSSQLHVLPELQTPVPSSVGRCLF